MSLSLRDLLYLTSRSLSSNPLRSALTTLGTFMGVAAVSATLQVGNVSRAILAEKLAQREAPQTTLFPAWSSDPSLRVRLRLEDMDYLKQRLVGVNAVSALRWVGMRTVSFRDREATPEAIAVSQDAQQTAGMRLLEGRYFSTADFANYRPVTIIDQALARQLFDPGESPVGQQIYTSRQPYTVVGVIQTKTIDGDEESVANGQLIITLAFFSALTGDRTIHAIRVRPTAIDDIERAGEQAESIMVQRFPGRRFESWNNVEDLIEQQKIQDMAANALAAVGIISLLVGGVGIANIMIAAVTERTSEIGIRRAIGATQQEIMVQFLLEAAILSLIGGISAIATVHGLALVVSDQFKLPYQFDTHTAAIALGSALTVGVGASLLPAIRASQLEPVKALRSE